MKRFMYSLLTLPMLVATVAFAAAPAAIEGGPGVYKVQNVTQGGAWQDEVVQANCGDTLKFNIRIHNTSSTGEANDPSTIQNVVLKATLPSGQVSNFTSTATISSSNAGSVSDTTTVNLSSPATIQFVSGPAGITQGGASIGDVKKLQQVQFQAKVVCPATPVTVEEQQPLAQTGLGEDILVGAVLTALAGTGYAISRRKARKA